MGIFRIHNNMRRRVLANRQMSTVNTLTLFCLYMTFTTAILAHFIVNHSAPALT